jgi:predicted transcriptional regulator
MADHHLGSGQYVQRSGKLESSNTVTWRVLVPEDSNFDWKRVKAEVGSHKGRIEYRLTRDPTDIKAGIAVTEKMALFTFPDAMGRLDFNSGFRSNSPLFREWCQDLFTFHWSRAEKKVQL